MARLKQIKKPVKGVVGRKQPAPQPRAIVAIQPTPLPTIESMDTTPDLTRYIGAKTYEEYVRQPKLPGLPQFLRDAALAKPTVTTDKLKALLDAQTGTKREWIMPDNSPEAHARRAAEKVENQKRQIFAHDETVAVTVSVRTDEGIKTLAVYQNMPEFREKHDFGTYPFKECRSDKEQTVILVTAKPWANKAPKLDADGIAVPVVARVKVGGGKTKAEIIGEMLMRPEGTTAQEVRETMGWPSVSMPAQARAAGLKLRKEKVGALTKYWGTK